jgi:hypothetical protein
MVPPIWLDAAGRVVEARLRAAARLRDDDQRLSSVSRTQPTSREAGMSERSAAGLTVLGVCVVVASVSMRLSEFGWFGLVLSPVYFVVACSHIVIHIWVAYRTKPPSRWTISIIMASHLALIAAFLLQYDAGNPPGFILVDELIGYTITPGWLRGWLRGWQGLGYDLAVFAPTVLCYFLLWRCWPRFQAEFVE